MNTWERNDTEYEPDGYSRTIELTTPGVYDPTYEGDDSHGTFYVRTCHTCGVLVDIGGIDNHTEFHKKVDRFMGVT